MVGRSPCAGLPSNGQARPCLGHLRASLLSSVAFCTWRERSCARGFEAHLRPSSAYFLTASAAVKSQSGGNIIHGRAQRGLRETM